MMLDSSGLLALFDSRLPQHGRAVAAFESAPRRIVHNYVLAELHQLALARKYFSASALRFLHAASNVADITLIWVDRETHDEAVALLIARPDKDYSLCDAVSFVLMRKFGIRDALTADHHFEQEGFTRLLA